MNGAKYQLFDDLRPEERAALEADITSRGVLVPVEVDEEGNILDGHNRVEIATRLGKPYETITRRFPTEEEKLEHIFKLNLARRHLDPLRWGLAFQKLLELRDVGRGQGARNDKRTSATVAQVASECGVSTRTAFHRLRLANQLGALPEQEKAEVLAGRKRMNRARYDVQKENWASEQDRRREEERQRQSRAQGVWNITIPANPVEENWARHWDEIVSDPDLGVPGQYARVQEKSEEAKRLRAQADRLEKEARQEQHRIDHDVTARIIERFGPPTPWESLSVRVLDRDLQAELEGREDEEDRIALILEAAPTDQVELLGSSLQADLSKRDPFHALAYSRDRLFQLQSGNRWTGIGNECVDKRAAG